MAGLRGNVWLCLLLLGTPRLLALPLPIVQGWLTLAAPVPLRPIVLAGAWDFFWQQRLGPLTERWPVVEERAEVGQSWNGFLNLQSGLARGARGEATYRLRLTGLPRGEYELALAGGASQVAVYAEGQEGQAVVTQASEDVKLRFSVLDSYAIWVVAIQVRNLDRSEGGLLSVPVLRLLSPSE